MASSYAISTLWTIVSTRCSALAHPKTQTENRLTLAAAKESALRILLLCLPILDSEEAMKWCPFPRSGRQLTSEIITVTSRKFGQRLAGNHASICGTGCGRRWHIIGSTMNTIGAKQHD